jgi:transposase
MTEQPQSRVRKSYTREYKLEAVRLATTGDRSIAQVARDLGINKNTLYNWRKDLAADPEQAFPGKGRLKPPDEELRRLRRALQRAEQERDFLKKAALWLAQEAHRSTGS